MLFFIVEWILRHAFPSHNIMLVKFILFEHRAVKQHRDDKKNKKKKQKENTERGPLHNNNNNKMNMIKDGSK